jgi:hypothetical protein
MRLALNMTKMAKEGFLRAAIEEAKYLIETPHSNVQEEKQRGVQFPWHKKMKAAIQRHPAMLRQNEMSGCLSCQNVNAKNPQTHWTRKATSAPPPAQLRERIPEATPPVPGTPPATTGNTSGARSSVIVNLPAGYTYSHIARAWAEFFEDDDDTEHNTDFDPDMPTDEG